MVKPAADKTKRDPQRTRARILAAATREFASNGLGGARVDQIAARAHSNERMLYYYFDSKDKLFVAVLEEAYLAFWRAESKLKLDHLEPVAGITRLVEFIWNYYVAHPEFIRLLNAENQHQAKFLKKSRNLTELVSPALGMLRAVLVRGQEDGVFRSGLDPSQIYIMIAALGYFYLSNRYTLSAVLGRDLMSPVAQAEHLAHITEVVLNHLLKHKEG
jgi:AcrR family transcriptional regulator